MKKMMLLIALILTGGINLQGQAIEVTNFEGLKPRLHHQNDTTYVVNFWATWCKPCIKEMPAFQKLNRQFADRPFKLLLVSLDFPSQIDSRLKPYLRENDIRAEVVVLDDPDSNSWISRVSEQWSGALPGTLIYKRNSRQFYEKTFEYHELEKLVINQINK